MELKDFSFEKHYQVQKPEYDPEQWHQYQGGMSDRTFVIYALIGIAIFLATYMVHNHMEPKDLLAPEVHAEEVSTLEGACAYAGLYPEKVTNLKQLTTACENNGTPVQPL